MTSSDTGRRLIEDWLPINEISVEAVREGGALAGHPPVNQLHVWWSRKPLIASRATVAASMLSADTDRAEFITNIGTSSEVVTARKRMDEVKATGQWSNVAFPNKRSFLHSPKSLTTGQDMAPTVLDLSAGGGSIPFEAGRLGFRSIANELNPVAGIILRATCEWPQKYGWELLEHFQDVRARFLDQVRELTSDLYPKEQQPEANPRDHQDANAPAERCAQTYLFARTVTCPSCEGTIPLAVHWRLDSKGTGIRVIPDTNSGTCSFEVATRASDQSPGSVSRAKATCPYPNCGATTPAGYISQEAKGGRLGHQLYCIIYRDTWHTETKSRALSKRPKTARGFRVPTMDDDNTAEVDTKLTELAEPWERENILPTEEIFRGDKTATPLDYGMPRWRDMFSPRQLLAHGYCVQAFHDLVDEDREANKLDENRKAAWCYIALAIDKMINRNSLMTRWEPRSSTAVGTFDSHDFGMKWGYSEMAIAIEGLGLDWALNDLENCLRQLIQMSGQQRNETPNGELMPVGGDKTVIAPPSKVTIGPAQDTDLPSASVDAIVFDPPYHNNVNYAELSDFFYVWLKRTAGYVIGDSLMDRHLTDKVNEAIASPARFREEAKGSAKSASALATRDYENKMAEIFRECRRVIKPDGIMTVMFTHKSTDAWDALTVALIESGFGITRTWPVKTEADSSIHIMDRAAARSTILLVCRPRTDNPTPEPWHVVESRIAQAVRADIPTLQDYGLSPVDQYLAAFGPALQVISEHWGTERAVSNPDRPGDEFAVTPTDALQVARREVLAHRTKEISQSWSESSGDPATRFYILAQDGAGAATIAFDEANLFARAIGLDLSSNEAKRILVAKGDKVTLKSARDRLAENIISPQRPAQTALDQVHTAIAITDRHDSAAALEWLNMQHHNPQGPEFKGTMEALIRVTKLGHEDLRPATNLWRLLYEDAPPVQMALLDALAETSAA